MGEGVRMSEEKPTCYVIAGPNGAGKTTFAMRYLPRVANGGHNIPVEAITRRYAKSLSNLIELYMELADYLAVWNNSAHKPVCVYERGDNGELIFDDAIWNEIMEYRS